MLQFFTSKILSNIDIQEEGNWQEEIRLGLEDLIFDHALKNYAEKASSWKTIPLCSKFLNSSKLAQPGLRTIASPAKDDKIHISRHQQTRLTNWFAVVSTSIRSNKPFVAILLAWLTASFIFATAKQGMLRPLFTNVFQISTPEYPNLGKFIIDILVFFHVISDGPHKKKKEKGSENSFLGNWITILRNNRAHTVITHLWWFSGSINFSKPFDSCPFKTYKIWNWSTRSNPILIMVFIRSLLETHGIGIKSEATKDKSHQS